MDHWTDRDWEEWGTIVADVAEVKTDEKYRPSLGDEEFSRLLRGSIPSVNLVGEFLKGKGFQVTVPGIKEITKFEDWKKNADNGDILTDRGIFEVKHRTVQFTGKNDWPFGPLMIVDEVKKWHRKDPKPRGYFIVSEDLSHYAFLDAKKTRDQWTEGTRRDRNWKGDRLFFFCHVDLFTWGKFETTGGADNGEKE